MTKVASWPKRLKDAQQRVAHALEVRSSNHSTSSENVQTCTPMYASGKHRLSIAYCGYSLLPLVAHPFGLITRNAQRSHGNGLQALLRK